MGPYYLTSLVTLLGPVVSVSGSTSRSARTRVVETGPLAGTAIPVNVDTHSSALLTHRSGIVSTVTMSFEIWATRAPLLEIHGTGGTIAVPDPNRFSDDVELFTSAEPTWQVAPVSAGYADAGRGYGLADMARAIETDRPHRASGELAFHVLEIMDAIVRSGATRQVIELESTVERPEPVPLGATPDSW
jgi:predicted dehydrogenase